MKIRPTRHARHNTINKRIVLVIFCGIMIVVATTIALSGILPATAATTQRRKVQNHDHDDDDVRRDDMVLRRAPTLKHYVPHNTHATSKDTETQVTIPPLVACGITVNKLNDEYCDCPDGSDETETSACSPIGNGIQCRLVPHGHQGIVKPSKINDGVRDCCDGTDERFDSTWSRAWNTLIDRC